MAYELHAVGFVLKFSFIEYDLIALDASLHQGVEIRVMTRVSLLERRTSANNQNVICNFVDTCQTLQVLIYIGAFGKALGAGLTPNGSLLHL